MRSLFFHVLFLLIIASLTLAMVLTDGAGTARIVWHDYIIETSAAFIALATVLSGYAFYLLLSLWHFLRHGPERWRLRRRLQKTEEGYQRLTQGFIALAGGSTAEAGFMAVKARKTLGITPLTQLLQAQTAQVAGDKAAAREIFRALAASPETAALGYRGLIAEARRDDNWGEVTALAEKLKLTSPKTPLLHLIQFETAARRQDWDEALVELNRASNADLIDAVRAKQSRAALFVAQSQRALQTGAFDKALTYAEQAMRFAPDWAPAVINLAQCQLGAGHERAANRTIEKHWNKAPHPQLAEIFASAEESPMDAFSKIEKLCRNNPENPIVQTILADAALKASIWGEARRHLTTLVNKDQATASTYKLLASLERREHGDDLAAARWLTKAAEATSDPTWLCQSCGGAHSVWHATCNYCGNFNTLEWQSAGRSRTRDLGLTVLTASALGE